uniref:Uncharacterized protein n=1 Tax=Staphylococcus phage Pel53 TaxID=3234048 RepID=A0AB39C6Q3_9CAUD
MIRKHSIRVIKARNVHTGEMEAFAFLGGRFYLFGWEVSNSEFKFFMDMYSIKELLNNATYGPSFMEYCFGKPVEHLLSKSFIYSWTTNQPMYGVPF